LACGAISIGVLVMHTEMAEESTPLDSHPAVSPAVLCTVNLAIQFFAVRLLLSLYTALRPFLRSGRGACSAKLYEVLKLASSTVFFAPMLCILFIAAQIRANQVGQPLPPWTKAAFHICTIGLFVQTLLTVALPYLPGLQLDAKKGTRWMEGDVQFGSVSDKGPCVGVMLTILRYLPMLLICGGFTAVIASFFASSSSGGSPPVPPAIQCASALTVQFFLVYLGLRVAISIRDVTHGCQGDGGALVQTFYSATATVHFCPMLAIIFIALRMRVQQVLGKDAAPQGWAQDGMYLASWAVLAQLMVCLLIGCATGSPPEVEDDCFHVQADAKESNNIVQKVAIAIQAVSLAALYCGAIAVCVSLFTVTPETTGAHGAIVPTALPVAL